MTSLVALLFKASVIALLSPLATLEWHVTPMVPDWRDSQVYVSIVTSSFAALSILISTEALEVMVVLDLREMVRLKVMVVGVATLGTTNVAVGEVGFWIVAWEIQMLAFASCCASVSGWR